MKFEKTIAVALSNGRLMESLKKIREITVQPEVQAICDYWLEDIQTRVQEDTIGAKHCIEDGHVPTDYMVKLLSWLEEEGEIS